MQFWELSWVQTCFEFTIMLRVISIMLIKDWDLHDNSKAPTHRTFTSAPMWQTFDALSTYSQQKADSEAASGEVMWSKPHPLIVRLQIPPSVNINTFLGFVGRVMCVKQTCILIGQARRQFNKSHTKHCDWIPVVNSHITFTELRSDWDSQIPKNVAVFHQTLLPSRSDGWGLGTRLS